MWRQDGDTNDRKRKKKGSSDRSGKKAKAGGHDETSLESALIRGLVKGKQISE